MALCDATLNTKLSLKPVHKVILAIVGVYLGAFPHFLHPSLLGSSMYGWVAAIPVLTDKQRAFMLMVLGAACLLTLLVHSRRMQAVFSGPLCRYLGAVSFSLYLTHIGILLSLTPPLFLLLYEAMPGHYHLAAWLSLALTLPVMFTVATLTYHYVERPAITLAGQFYRAGLRPVALGVYTRLSRTLQPAGSVPVSTPVQAKAPHGDAAAPVGSRHGKPVSNAVTD